MNKDFKSILVLGIVAIIISWIGLFQFRDVKFRNTKDIEQNKKEQQEQLLNEYKELVDVYIPTITDQLQENDLPTTWNINIIMPVSVNYNRIRLYDFVNKSMKKKYYKNVCDIFF